MDGWILAMVKYFIYTTEIGKCYKPGLFLLKLLNIYQCPGFWKGSGLAQLLSH